MTVEAVEVIEATDRQRAVASLTLVHAAGSPAAYW